MRAECWHSCASQAATPIMYAVHEISYSKVLKDFSEIRFLLACTFTCRHKILSSVHFIVIIILIHLSCCFFLLDLQIHKATAEIIGTCDPWLHQHVLLLLGLLIVPGQDGSAAIGSLMLSVSWLPVLFHRSLMIEGHWMPQQQVVCKHPSDFR